MPSRRISAKRPARIGEAATAAFRRQATFLGLSRKRRACDDGQHSSRKIATKAKDELMRRCQTILAALHEGHTVPPRDLREMLEALSAGSPFPAQINMAGAIQDALGDVEGALLRRVIAAEHAIQAADDDACARAAGTSAASTSLSTLHVQVGASKQAVTCAKAALADVSEVLAGFERVRRDNQKALRTSQQKQTHLEKAERDFFEPLLEAPAIGADGRKRLADLQKVGKTFGFHEVLLRTMPFVLRKHPERRETFDGLTVKQVGAEFAKHAAAVEAVVREGKQATAEHDFTLEAARAALAGAKDDLAVSESQLVLAEAALLDGKTELATARRRSRSSPMDRRRAEVELRDSHAQLESFRGVHGPLAAVEALRRNGVFDAARSVVIPSVDLTTDSLMT